MNQSLDNANGFISNAFGPSIWFHLHCVSLNFPLTPSPGDRALYRTWFESTLKVLPCRACRDNTTKNLIAIRYDPDYDLLSRYHFSHMIWRLHSRVNAECTATPPVTYEEFVNKYSLFRATGCNMETCSDKRWAPRCQILIASDCRPGVTVRIPEGID